MLQGAPRPKISGNDGESNDLLHRAKYTTNAGYEPADAFHGCTGNVRFTPARNRTVTDSVRSWTHIGTPQPALTESFQPKLPSGGFRLSAGPSGHVPCRYGLGFMASLHFTVVAVMALGDGCWHLLRLYDPQRTFRRAIFRASATSSDKFPDTIPLAARQAITAGSCSSARPPLVDRSMHWRTDLEPLRRWSFSSP
ncbi:MAG: hypothetical protein M1816_007719 [Peltula sp. TS41687]|nr:MAG: hypothetical protein M1816_007719 [Peltula sp. TS41687]